MLGSSTQLNWSDEGGYTTFEIDAEDVKQMGMWIAWVIKIEYTPDLENTEVTALHDEL
jgi:hypothetical protein